MKRKPLTNAKEIIRYLLQRKAEIACLDKLTYEQLIKLEFINSILGYILYGEE